MVHSYAVALANGKTALVSGDVTSVELLQKGELYMKFSNRTIYDKERLIRFNNFVVLKKRFFWVFMIVCTVLVSISFALTLALKSYDSTILLCFALIMVVDITCSFCSLILPRITINKATALNADILFEFQDDTFKISATTKNGTESSELNYSALIKVMESNRDIYLYISTRQAYILDKSGFNFGCPSEFVKFLKDKNIPYKK